MFAADESDSILDCLNQQLRSVHRLRKLNPNRHSTVRAAPTCVIGKVFLERFQHDIAPLRISLLDTLDVFGEQPSPGEFEDRRLRQQARVQIGSLFGSIEMIDNYLRRGDPANSQPWKPDL